MNPNFALNLSCKGVKDKLNVSPAYKETGLCTYAITDTSGYLFTLVPSDNPFTDFELSERDRELDQPIDLNLVEQVKTAIINHYL